ncbi:MAG: lytic murein transglycosylase [Acidimicrobiales bacterium]
MSRIIAAVARLLVGATVTVALSAGAWFPAQATPPAVANPRQVAPEPVPVGAQIDPALAGVKVASPALRVAQAGENRAQGALEAAEGDLTGIRRTLGSLAVVRIQTEESLAAAGRAIVAAAEVRRAEQAQLRQAQAIERGAGRRLAEARAEVRVVAVAGYISGFDTSADLFIDDPDEALEAGRRQVLGTAVGGDKVAQVVARSEDRRRAATARRAAGAEVDQAEAVLTDAQATQRRVAAELQDVDVRIAGARTDEQAQMGEVLAAGLRREAAHLEVLDARVLSMVVDADLPLVALDAYWKAAAASPCPTEWWALAAIGRTESFHGTYGGTTLDASGNPARKIIGIALDGSNETAAVLDTDGGLLDGDVSQDRAVGPMQFIPSTWARWATDGNGDGVKDPQSLYDATAAAARYLCAASGDLRSDEGLRRAYFSYNHSLPYVDIVLGRARSYATDAEIPPVTPT